GPSCWKKGKVPRLPQAVRIVPRLEGKSRTFELPEAGRKEPPRHRGTQKTERSHGWNTDATRMQHREECERRNPEAHLLFSFSVFDPFSIRGSLLSSRCLCVSVVPSFWSVSASDETW